MLTYVNLLEATFSHVFAIFHHDLWGPKIRIDVQMLASSNPDFYGPWSKRWGWLLRARHQKWLISCYYKQHLYMVTPLEPTSVQLICFIWSSPIDLITCVWIWLQRESARLIICIIIYIYIYCVYYIYLFIMYREREWLIIYYWGCSLSDFDESIHGIWNPFWDMGPYDYGGISTESPLELHPVPSLHCSSNLDDVFFSPLKVHLWVHPSIQRRCFMKIEELLPYEIG